MPTNTQRLKPWTKAQIHPDWSRIAGQSTTELSLRLKPPAWEHRTYVGEDIYWGVNTFRVEMEGSAYEVMLTARPYNSTQCAPADSYVFHEPDYTPRAFTLTMFGSPFVDHCLVHGRQMTPSAGRTYRWREGELVHGPTLQDKLGLSAEPAKHLITLLAACGHNTSPV